MVGMPTKSVDFPAGLENEIEREVERGRYQSRSELVRDAVRHLLDEQGPRLTAAEAEELQRRRTMDDTISHEQVRDDLG